MKPSEATITVWKSDFKDFPGLYEVTMWCMGVCQQKAKNFVVIGRGYNPYELCNDKQFIESHNFEPNLYSRCIEIAKGEGWEKEVTEMLHSMEHGSRRVMQRLNAALCYPKGHTYHSFL